MRHKELFWMFCFLVFLGVNISFVVLVEYIILFLILLAIIHIKAKSVQQWFEQGEVLAKVGITARNATAIAFGEAPVYSRT